MRNIKEEIAVKHSPGEIGMVDLRNPREVLSHRAKRLVAFLELPATPKTIVAEEVFLIFKAGLTYCGRTLADTFLNWFAGDSCRELATCSKCSSFTDNSFAGCSSCGKKVISQLTN